MSQLLEYLPPFEGYLPKWLFLVCCTLAVILDTSPSRQRLVSGTCQMLTAKQVSVVSIANTAQAYRSVAYANDLYNGRSATGGPPSNPLSARTFATWTFVSGIVRLYTAYNITTPAVYDLGMWTFGVALAHFVSEWLGHGTAQLKGRFVSPLIVASGTLAWMLTQRESYLAA